MHELWPFEVAEQGVIVVRPSPGDKPGSKFLDRFQLVDMSGIVGIPWKEMSRNLK